MFRVAIRVVIFGLLVILSLPTDGSAQIDKSELEEFLEANQELIENNELETLFSRMESSNFGVERLAYRAAISQANDGNTELSIAFLKYAVERWPDSRFALDSNTLIAAFENQPATSKSFASLFKKSMESFKNHEYVVVVKVESSDGTDSSRFYLGLDLKHENCQLRFQENEETVVQFELNPDGIRLYSKKNKQIISVDEQAFFTLQPSIKQNDDDSFSIKFSGSVTSNPKKALSKIREFLSSPWMSTEKGIEQLFVQRAQSASSFISSVKTESGVSKVRFLTPKQDGPGFSISEWGFEGGRLKYLDCAPWKIKFIEHGNEKDKQSSLPSMAWPEVETKKEEMSVELITNFVNEVATTLAEMKTDPTTDLSSETSSTHHSLPPSTITSK